VGSAAGKTLRYQAKYCAVQTLLKVTKSRVCRATQRGRSRGPRRQEAARRRRACGRKARSPRRRRRPSAAKSR